MDSDSTKGYTELPGENVQGQLARDRWRIAKPILASCAIVGLVAGVGITFFASAGGSRPADTNKAAVKVPKDKETRFADAQDVMDADSSRGTSASVVLDTPNLSKLVVAISQDLKSGSDPKDFRQRADSGGARAALDLDKLVADMQKLQSGIEHKTDDAQKRTISVLRGTEKKVAAKAENGVDAVANASQKELQTAEAELQAFRHRLGIAASEQSENANETGNLPQMPVGVDAVHSAFEKLGGLFKPPTESHGMTVTSASHPTASVGSSVDSTTKIAISGELAVPQGVYCSHKSLLCQNAIIKMDVKSAARVDVWTQTKGCLDNSRVQCAEERYTLSKDGSEIHLTDVDTEGDCIHDHMARLGVHLDTISFQSGADSIIAAGGISFPFFGYVTFTSDFEHSTTGQCEGLVGASD